MEQLVNLLINLIENLSKRIDLLNSNVDDLRSMISDGLITPAIEAYKADDFNRFNEQYGERLNKNDPLIKKVMGYDDNYMSSKETYDQLQKAIESGAISKDANLTPYIDSVEKELNSWIDDLRKSLGVAPDTPISVESDDSGQVKVAVDTDGDGEKESVVETGSNAIGDFEVRDELTPEMARDLGISLDDTEDAE